MMVSPLASDPLERDTTDDREFSNIPPHCRCVGCVGCVGHVYEAGQDTGSPLEWKQFSLKAVPASVDENLITIVPLLESRFAVPVETDDACSLQKWDFLDLRSCHDWDTIRSRIDHCFSLWDEVLKRCSGITGEEFNNNRNLLIGVRVLQKTLLRCLGQYSLVIHAYHNVVDSDINGKLACHTRKCLLFDQSLATHLRNHKCSKQLAETAYAVGY
jgi:hypothetical protein